MVNRAIRANKTRTQDQGRTTKAWIMFLMRHTSYKFNQRAEDSRPAVVIWCPAAASVMGRKIVDLIYERVVALLKQCADNCVPKQKRISLSFGGHRN